MNAAIQFLRCLQEELIDGVTADLEEALGEDDMPLLHNSTKKLLELRGGGGGALKAASSLLNQVKMQVAKDHPRFEGHAQCDAHEFLHCLIMALHRQCNRGAGDAMQYKEICDKAKKETDDDAAARWKRIFTARDDSTLTDLFTGQLKSVVQCKTCGKKSLNFDAMWELHVELGVNISDNAELTAKTPSSTCSGKKGGGGKRNSGSSGGRAACSVNLQDLLNQQLRRQETIDGFACSNCNEGMTSGNSKRRIFSTVIRSVTISDLPRYLILHLRRFTFDGRREMSSVRFSPTIELCCESNGHRPTEFRLVGTVAHHGDSPDEGHYTAHCLVGGDEDNGQWLHCDDETVQSASIGSVCSEDVEVYLLLFRRCD